MKKIFTLIAVAAMAISANAQTIDYSAMKSADEYTIANATLNASESKDNKKVYDIEANAELNWYLNSATNVIFQITNTSAKAKIFVVNLNDAESTNKASVEFGGKNGIVLITNPQVGDAIKMVVAAKGSTAGKIGVLPSEGTEITGALDLPAKSKGAEGADEEGYFWKELSFTVAESMIKSLDGVKVVRVKETAGGYRCKSISINGGADGIAAVKAAKADAAMYNLAGQKVANDFKGLVIKDGKKMIRK